MLSKIVAMFRNLLISSFDATIRVKRAFHPALASRGFASHVFLVIIAPIAVVVVYDNFFFYRRRVGRVKGQNYFNSDLMLEE